jgi:glycosyltransferase involved in cell wall biosynthesis
MTLKLGIVVPCYNEEAVLPETGKRLLDSLDAMRETGLVSAQSTIHFVDDGSRDKTWELIRSLSAADPRVHGIRLSCNRGHQNALLAGLFGAEGDALLTVDADLQDDLEAIPEMVRAHLDGAEIVYGARKSRKGDSFLKRGSATLYYRLLRWMGVDIVENHADYRLMGRRALGALKEFSEVNLFLRGVVPLLGYRATTVYYDRAERFAGESKYSLRKMISLALNGITSLSVVPLRLITATGFVVSVFSFLMIVWVVYGSIFLHAVVPGWASTVIPVYFLGGIQLVSIGILGEYVAKIYLETKRRPRYLIDEVI